MGKVDMISFYSLTLLCPYFVISFRQPDDPLFAWLSNGGLTTLNDRPLSSGLSKRPMNFDYYNTDRQYPIDHHNSSFDLMMSKLVTPELSLGRSKNDVLQDVLSRVLHQVLGEHREQHVLLKKKIMNKDWDYKRSIKEWFDFSSHNIGNLPLNAFASDSFWKKDILHLLVKSTQRSRKSNKRVNTRNETRLKEDKKKNMNQNNNDRELTNRTKSLIEDHWKITKEKYERDIDAKARNGKQIKNQFFPGHRARRDDRAVMYLPVGSTNPGPDGCPDSVDAAAVSISQLVFLSLCLGVFTAVANVANNINNNNDNNNNNNDNNINSNNLNFAANANAGNQITVQIPPGRKKRDLILQRIINRINPRNQAIQHLRKSKAVRRRLPVSSRKTVNKKLDKSDEKPPVKDTENEEIDVTNSRLRKMNLFYDTKIPKIQYFIELRNINKVSQLKDDISSPQSSHESIVNRNPLEKILLEKHYKNIKKIADRHGYYISIKDVPSLLQRQFGSDFIYTPREINSYRNSDYSQAHLKTSNVPPEVSYDSIEYNIISKGNISKKEDREKSEMVPQAKSNRYIEDTDNLNKIANLSNVKTSENVKFPKRFSQASSRASGQPKSPLMTNNSFQLTKVTSSGPLYRDIDGLAAKLVLKAAARSLPLALPIVPSECLMVIMCQAKKSRREESWMAAITEYTLYKAITGSDAPAFPDFMQAAEKGLCADIFPACSNSNIPFEDEGMRLHGDQF